MTKLVEKYFQFQLTLGLYIVILIYLLVDEIFSHNMKQSGNYA